VNITKEQVNLQSEDRAANEKRSSAVAEKQRRRETARRFLSLNISLSHSSLGNAAIE